VVTGAVTTNDTAHVWDVDFATGLASCCATLVKFNHSVEHGIDIAFVSGHEDRSLEWQCAMAGSAIEAVQDEMRYGRGTSAPRDRPLVASEDASWESLETA